MKSSLECINPNSAGIDIGSKSHFVAVPNDRDKNPIREFKFFTEDLHALAKWLKSCNITTVAMEATGSYWIPLFDVLEQYGFEVYIVNGRYVKNVSGRKSDVQDCQWIQQLHSFGLLHNSFIPAQEIRSLRHLVRFRDNLVRQNSRHIQLMQKYLVEMNLQLHNVISDISGDTGLRIVRAIIAGERDPKILSQYRDPRCKNSQEIIEKSLFGHYKEEVIFSLKQTLSTYDHILKQIQDCDLEIERIMKNFIKNPQPNKEIKKKRESKKNRFNFDAQSICDDIIGVNLMNIPGVNVKVILTIISEIGLDFQRFKTAKHFTSWIGLAPNNKISGGKMLRKGTTHTHNKIKEVLRMAASSVEKTKTALGAFCRKVKSKAGAPKAYTATARKMAEIIYNMVTRQEEYNQEYEASIKAQHNEYYTKKLQKQAKSLGYQLIPIDVGNSSNHDNAILSTV